MKTIRLIELFLEGKLEVQELNDFLERLRTDPSFAEEVKLHKDVNESITDEGALKLREQIKTLFAKPRTPSIKLFIWVSAIAAAVIVSFSLYSLTSKPDYKKAYTDYYYPYEVDLNTRSGEKVISDLNLAYKLYQNGDYQTAYNQLKSYDNTVTDNYPAIFYLGISAIELEKYTEAETYLIKVSSKSNSPYSLHANWYLSMMYLNTNQSEKAKIILQNLSSGENYYSVRSKKLLNRFF